MGKSPQTVQNNQSFESDNIKEENQDGQISINNKEITKPYTLKAEIILIIIVGIFVSVEGMGYNWITAVLYPYLVCNRKIDSDQANNLLTLYLTCGALARAA